MRWLGVARRAFDMLCERSLYRYAHGAVLAKHQTIQNWIADSEAEMQAARLMTLHAAWKMDTEGVAAARKEIALIKFYGAKVLHDVVDRALQAHGGARLLDRPAARGDVPLRPRRADLRRARRGPPRLGRPPGPARLRGARRRVPTEFIPARREAARRAVRRAARGRHGQRLTAGRAYTLDRDDRRVPETILLAAPRGYCAGVDRAVQTVERALELYGAPVYVRKEIVHNKHVVEQLRARGAVFVDSESEVPEGATVVFSAHGVAPSVHANAQRAALQTIDATCPLVTKVHVEAKKFAAEGYTIVLIGHAGHEEVEGTMGEAPEQHRPDRGRGRRRRARGHGPDEGRLHLADDAVGRRDARRSSAGCGSASRRSSGRAPTTSVTRPPTARRRSSSSPASRTWCW